MREVIVLQPARCKRFGPALNGEDQTVANPLAAFVRSSGWGGAAFGPPFLLMPIGLCKESIHRNRVGGRRTPYRRRARSAVQATTMTSNSW
jgi:hypothetical protein